MATPELARPRRRYLRRILRVLVVLVLLIATGLAAVLGWGYHAARASLPQLDGTIRVAGLQAEVTVVRDPVGMPHIAAADFEDLFFAQGYVTAQDRLWQMDLSRRYAAGELSELFGSATLEIDRQARILGLRAVAERTAAELTADERARLEAYARGVNAYIDANREHLPLEFRVLRYQPRPWTPTDSLLIVASMADMLSGERWDVKLGHERILAQLGPDLANDLFPASSWRDHPPGQDTVQPTEEPEEEQPEDETRLPLLPAPAYAGNVPDLLTPGSNNWVVSGAHTASGKPVLSNDMHLPHSIPNVWYEVDLRAGDFHVAGVSLPGTPYVVAGHNERIVWGITNLGPDVQDLYVEEFNPAGQYRAPDGWRTPEHRREVIRVRGKDDVVLDVVVTRHGPIISDLLEGETRRIALRWTLYDAGGLNASLFAVDAARNWDEFRRGWSQFTSPSLNIVYADIDGHIGYQAIGRIPTRASGDNPVPVPGADDTHEWTGTVPFEALPRVFDPPSGIIATANGRIAPDGYPFNLGDIWDKPYRTERIYSLLRSHSRLTAADMLGIQTDVYSTFDRFVAQRLVYAIDHTPAASPRAHAAADVMRSWDGRITADSAAATLAVRARMQLWKLILGPRIGDVAAYRWPMSPVVLEKLLTREPRAWLPPAYSDYNTLLTAAVEKAVSADEAPKDLAQWRWGNISTIQIEHPLFGRVPLLSHWTGTPRLPQSGNNNTVKQVGRMFGPSERFTVDLAAMDTATLNIVNGQSGNLLSPHYDDQWIAWYNGTSFPWPFSTEATAKAAAHRLILAPQ